MYDISILPVKLVTVMKFNPLYQYINFAREIILFNRVPSLESWLFCAGYAIIALLIGTIVFRKNQDKFIYYI